MFNLPETTIKIIKLTIFIIVIKKIYNQFGNLEVANIVEDIVEDNNSNIIEIPGTNLELYLPKQRKTKLKLPKYVRKIIKKLPIKTLIQISGSLGVFLKNKIKNNNQLDHNEMKTDLNFLEKLIDDALKETKND